MPVGAGNPQLKLQVSLDLAFLRSQLSTIGSQLGGQALNIGLKINRQSIVSEYRLLNRYFDNKTFRVSVETNIQSEIRYAETLQRKLKELSAQRVTNVASQAATGRAGGFIDEAQFNAYLNRLSKAPLEAVRSGLQSAGVQMQSAGKGTIAELRRSILSGLPQVTEDIAKGLIQGLDPGMKESGRQGARSVIDGLKQAMGIASPSKVFKELGKFTAEGFEIGFLNKFQQFQSRATSQVRQFVGVLQLELAKIQSGGAGIGRGNILGAGRGVRQYFSPIGPLPENSREPYAYNRQAFRYEPYLAQPGQERGFGVPPLQSRYPFAPAPPVRGAFSSFSPSLLGSAARALPAAGETSAAASRASALALREFEARTRSAARAATVFAEDAANAARRRGLEVASGQVPLGGGGRFLPPGGGGGGGRPPGGGGGFNLGPNFGRDLGQGFLGRGGAGVIGEIGREFGQATKQVLLFGTAYKALAAVVALPGNILNATANLQTFTNQLQAVTGGGQAMTDSLQLIENTVSRFNLPIESARAGFVRLYASMRPAGVSTAEINNLFTGLAATSATLGFSSDQVDRMTIALSQMASKGQISSEELKGQLGDVFPQAVGLFAEAAGFINDTLDEQARGAGLSKFLKALEDGAFRGEAMQKVLANVGVLLNQNFGAAGEIAAESFRGQINALNNALTSFYESFSTGATAFLGQFIQPITSALRTLTEAIRLAFTGDDITNNPLAAYLRNELFPQLNNLRVALIAAGQTFGVFAQGVAAVLRPLAQLVLGNGALLSSIARGITIFVLFRTVLAAVNALGIIPLITNIVRYGAVFRVFLAQKAAGVTTLTAFRGALVQTGTAATGAAGGIRTLATTIRVALVQSAVGIAIVAIGALIERITQLQAVAASVRARGQGITSRINAAAQGGTEALNREVSNVRAEINTARELQRLYTKGASGQSLTSAELQRIQDQGGDTSVFRQGGDVRGEGLSILTRQTEAVRAAELQGRNITTLEQRLQESLIDARKNAAVIDKRTADAAKINLAGLGADLTGAGAAGGGGGGSAAAERESQLVLLTLQAEKAKELFAIDQQIGSAQLANNTALVSSLELRKALIDIDFQAKEIALEKIPADEQQAKLAALRLQYDKAILDNRLQLQLALQKEREEFQKAIEERIKGYEDENKYQQRYYELVSNGINPEIAKTQVEIEKVFAAEKERLDLSIEQLEVQKIQTEATIAQLSQQQSLTETEQRRLQAEKERLEVLKEDLRLRGLQISQLPEGQQRAFTAAQQAQAPAPASVRFRELVSEAQKSLDELQDPVRQLQTIAEGVSGAIGNAFKELILGTGSLREVLANVFQSIAESFADMVAEMITRWLFFQIVTGIGNLFGLGGGTGTSNAFGSSGPTFNSSAFSGPALSSGNIFGAAGAGNFSSAFSASGPTSRFANGGIASGGITGFNNGGLVTGPTLGLVGEGRFNEAIVPLPNGRSIPVEFQGNNGGGNVNVVVNVDAQGTDVQGNDQSANQLGRVISVAVQNEIIKQQRPGGLLRSPRF